MADKRALSPDVDEELDAETGAIVAKKQKVEDQTLVVGSVTKEGIKRTSCLQAPIIQLAGHGGEVYSLRFSPDGDLLASASFDKTVFLWRTYHDNENFMVLQGHKNAVLEVHWFQDGETLLTCSADKTVRAWSVEDGSQVKKSAEHTALVNSVCPLRRGAQLYASGADDGTIKVWDKRVKRSVQTFKDKLPVCAVAFADAGDQVYTGGVDNTIKVWDLRKEEVSLTLKGHSNTVTGLRVSPDGTHLLSNSMDNTLREWDMRPYAPANRCTKVYTGHLHNFEQNLLRCDYSPDGSRVTAGSADRQVYVWEQSSRKLLYKLPGHTGSVNEVVFHPKEPIVASAASDKTIFLGELVQ